MKRISSIPKGWASDHIRHLLMRASLMFMLWRKVVVQALTFVLWHRTVAVLNTSCCTVQMWGQALSCWNRLNYWSRSAAIKTLTVPESKIKSLFPTGHSKPLSFFLNGPEKLLQTRWSMTRQYGRPSGQMPLNEMCQIYITKIEAAVYGGTLKVWSLHMTN